MKNEKQLATEKIGEITAKFNADMAELKAIIDKVVWPPEEGQRCHLINYDNNTIHEYMYHNVQCDNTKLKQCRLHPTREQAEFYRDFLELESKRTTVRFRLHEFAKRINDGWVADYDDLSQPRYSIYLDYKDKRIRIEHLLEAKSNALPVFKYDCTGELPQEFTFDEIAMLFEVVG